MIPPAQNTSGKVNSVTADIILEAHQLANPEILPILENLNWLTTNKQILGLTSNECFLKGILIAQEKEIEVLDSLDVSEMRPHLHSILATRRQALEISCEDLRRVLK